MTRSSQEFSAVIISRLLFSAGFIYSELGMCSEGIQAKIMKTQECYFSNFY